MVPGSFQEILLSETGPTRVKSGAKSFRKPRPDATRLLAFEVFTEVNRRDAYSNLILPRALSESALENRDRAFATELVYGALRMQGRHDWILSQVSDRPWESVDPGIVDVARLGVHQLFEMRVPDHAAVSATVELARKVLGESRASYVNALLRKVSAHPLSEWLAPLENMDDAIARYSIEYSHPEWIVSAYFDLLRETNEVVAALNANNIPASPTLVSWPGRSTQEDLIELGGAATQYSPYGATLLGIPGDVELVRSRRAGVQDEGSQIVAMAFASASKEKSDWLDLCAGPGGKAALLSSIASQSDIGFVANELSPVRAKLVEQVVVDAQVWVGDGRDVLARKELFGAVIADVPCTGIGALRRRPEIRWRRKPSDLSALTQLQRELFDSAISVTEIGGVAAYVTCSPHLAETKAQVIDALRRNPNIRQIPIQAHLPVNLSGAVVGDALQLWTHRHGTDAMFMALFERVS
jgi:16S rRNA (cytosine967-C5)-methyltransferase